jgi:predicted neuraminidase
LSSSSSFYANGAADAILVGSRLPRSWQDKIYSSFDGGNKWDVYNQFAGSIVDLTSRISNVLALLELEYTDRTNTRYYYDLRASIDSGKTWTSKGNPLLRTSDSFESLKLGVAGSKVYLFGLEKRYNDSEGRDEKRAIVNISDDIGTTWVKKDISSKIALELNCSLVQENAIYVSWKIMGFESELLKSEDGGETWTALPIPRSADCNDLFVSGQAIYVATDSGLVVSSDNGATWVNKTTADGLPSNKVMKLFALDSRLFVVTESGSAFGPQL